MQKSLSQLVCRRIPDFHFAGQRSLPSASSNKRKQQDAFGDVSAFTPSRTRGIVEPTGAADSAHKRAPTIKNDAAPSEVPRGISPRHSTVTKPQSIMTFTPMARLDKSHVRHNGLPETPSKTSRIASPGLPMPVGFKLPSATATSLQSRISGPTATRGASTSKANVGMSPLQSVMTPLSGLNVKGGVSKTGAHSPSTNLAKIRPMQSMEEGIQTNGNKQSASEDQIRSGLPAIPNLRALDERENDRSSSVEPESALFTEAFSSHDSFRNKGRQNE